MSNDTNEQIDYEKYIRLASEDYREDSMNNRADIMRDAADSYAALTERVKRLEAVEQAATAVQSHREKCACLDECHIAAPLLEKLASALDGAA